MKELFLSLFLFCSCVVSAQDVSFVVYHATGMTMAKSRPAALKKGDKLSASDVITVGSGANVVLLCKNHEALKLTTGRYEAKALLKRCEGKQGSYTTSYFKYVWEELTHPHGSPEKDPAKFMKNSGAVSRGCDNVETRLSFDTVFYSVGKLPVFFRTSIPQPHVSAYSTAEDGEVLLSIPLRRASFALDSLAAHLKEPGIYYWQITNAEAMGCPPNVLHILAKDVYRTAVNKIIQDVPQTTPAETAFMKAFLLEEAHYLAEALAYYQLAVKAEPNNPKYKLAQSRFYEE